MSRFVALTLLAFLLVPAATEAAGKKRNKRIAKKIGDGHYVGTRGDGESIDYIICKNGKYVINTGGGVSDGTKWKVTSSTKLKNGFEAIVTDKAKDGSSTEWAMKKLRGQWQIGYSFGSHEYGDVTRTSAKSACQDL